MSFIEVYGPLIELAAFCGGFITAVVGGLLVMAVAR